MLKPLALTLLIATFLASGFTLAPAEPAKKSTGLTQSETFTTENMTVIPLDDEEELILTGKSDREDIPKT